MSNDPGSSKIGEISKESFECDVISWKIPNVSSLEITESTEWLSPRFSYKNATWTLKMPLYSSIRTDRSINVAMERLHSEIPDHSFSYSIFFKEHGVMRFGTSYYTLHIDSNCKKMNLCFGYNSVSWYKLFRHSERYRRDDTITLVLEIVTKKNAVIGLDCDTESSRTDLSTSFTENEDYLKSAGEISTESFDVEVAAWKIFKINAAIPVDVDKSVQSPTFSFAGATWNLKLFLNGQTKFKSENNVDVSIERLNSEIQKHFILCRCSFKSYDENKSLENYYKELTCSATNGFILDSNHTQEDIIHIMSYRDFLNLSAFSLQFDTVILFELRIPKSHDTAWNILSESLPTVTESSKAISAPEPISFASTSEGYKDPTSDKVPSSFTTSKNISRAITGEITKESVDCEVITWKIPSASSLLHKKKNFVKSLPFSYKGAKWILKLCMKLDQLSLLNVVIERLDSQTPAHNLFIKIYFKKNIALCYEKSSCNCHWLHDRSIHNISDYLFFDANHSHSIMLWYTYREFPYIYKHCRIWDTLILVCEIHVEKNAVIKFDFETKSSETDLSNKCKINEKSSVGELFIESFDTEFITWKIPDIRSKSAEVYNELQSPSFAFEGASWIFKLYLDGQKKFKSEGNVDVLIERLNSEISKHAVSYKLFFRAHDDKFMEKKYNESFKDDSECTSFTFYPNHTKETATYVMSYADLLRLAASSGLCDTVNLVCELRTKKNFRKILNSEMTSVKDFGFGGAPISNTSTDFSFVAPVATTSNTNIGFKDINSASPSARCIFGITTPTVTDSRCVFRMPVTSSVSRTAFTLGCPTTSASNSGFSFSTGAFTSFAFKTPIPATTAAGFSHGAVTSTQNSGLTFGASASSPTTAGFSFGAVTSTQNSGLTLGASASSPTTAGFSFGAVPNTQNSGLTLGASASSPTTAGFSFGAVPNTQNSGLTLGAPVFSTTTVGFSFGAVSSTQTTAPMFGIPTTASTPSSSFQTVSNTTPSFNFATAATNAVSSTTLRTTEFGFDRKSSHCPVEKLLRDFKELFLNQEDCDVILKVKGQEFPAHRIILKARSSVFSCTFRNNMKEKATGIVDIEDCDPSSFSDFLRFLYCGSVENLSTENVFNLFKAADKYDVQDLRSECLEFIKKNLSVDTFCDTIALALQHTEKELIELATDFFAKNFQKIIVTVKWQSFLVENPIQGNEILIKALVNRNK